MATIPEIRSEETEMISPINHTTMLSKNLTAEHIISNMRTPVIIDPIDPKRISKESTNSLTKSSLVKAGLVFLGTVGAYYLAKTTNILSYFGWETKNSKDASSSKIMKIKNTKKSLSVRTNLETAQSNNPSINRIAQTYKTEDRAIEFEKIKVKEFENFQKIEKQENLGMQKSFSRRSINIQNPIPNQNAIVGKLFEAIIDGSNFFSSSDALFLEALNIPNWLTASNPRATLKGSYDTTPNYSFGVIVSGNYAYIATDSGLLIIDISDPTNPTFKGSFGTNQARGIAISGNYAYVADAWSGLAIINISNPSNPTCKDWYDTPGRAYGVAISGDYAYVASEYSGLQIVDISDPSNPTFKGSYDTPDKAWRVAISGNYAYVADNDSGLQIIDISDPSNPTFKGLCNTPDLIREVTLSGNYAYVTGWDSGLQIIDISDPSNPTFKGSYDTPGSAREVAVSFNYAYVSDGGSLQIIDISDPSNPTFKGLYDTPGNALGIALSNNYAYVADSDSGLQIIAPNLDKLILSGIPSSIGTYGVDIEACNELAECVTDSFDIIVRDIDDTTDTMDVTDTTDLTNSIVIIGSMTVAVCVTCIASFSLPLIIGAVIVMLRRHRNKILGKEDNTKEKELKEIKELKE